MNLEKIEYKLANGCNQFNITNEHNLILGVVAGFSNEENLKHATLFENAPQMLEMLEKAESTLNRLRLSMMAHPDNEENSEFEGYISLSEKVQEEIRILMKKTSCEDYL